MYLKHFNKVMQMLVFSTWQMGSRFPEISLPLVVWSGSLAVIGIKEVFCFSVCFWDQNFLSCLCFHLHVELLWGSCKLVTLDKSETEVSLVAGQEPFSELGFFRQYFCFKKGCLRNLEELPQTRQKTSCASTRAASVSKPFKTRAINIAGFVRSSSP